MLNNFITYLPGVIIITLDINLLILFKYLISNNKVL